MRREERHGFRGSPKFFRIALSHESLANHYQGNFIMMQHHKYSLTELNEMLPWEREVYISLLVDWVKEENDRIKKVNQKYGQM